MPETPTKPVKGHAFRATFQRRPPWGRRWECTCGEQYGAQPQVSQARARAAHRAHLADLAVRAAHDEMRSGDA